MGVFLLTQSGGAAKQASYQKMEEEAAANAAKQDTAQSAFGSTTQMVEMPKREPSIDARSESECRGVQAGLPAAIGNPGHHIYVTLLACALPFLSCAVCLRAVQFPQSPALPHQRAWSLQRSLAAGNRWRQRLPRKPVRSRVCRRGGPGRRSWMWRGAATGRRWRRSAQPRLPRRRHRSRTSPR